MGKLRHREVKKLAWGHTASGQQSQDLRWGSLISGALQLKLPSAGGTGGDPQEWKDPAGPAPIPAPKFLPVRTQTALRILMGASDLGLGILASSRAREDGGWWGPMKFSKCP